MSNYLCVDTLGKLYLQITIIIYIHGTLFVIKGYKIYESVLLLVCISKNVIVFFSVFNQVVSLLNRKWKQYRLMHCTGRAEQRCPSMKSNDTEKMCLESVVRNIY